MSAIIFCVWAVVGNQAKIMSVRPGKIWHDRPPNEPSAAVECFQSVERACSSIDGWGKLKKNYNTYGGNTWRKGDE